MGQKIKCCLCGETINANASNNALPLKDGRCCDACNWNKVIPVRLK